MKLGHIDYLNCYPFYYHLFEKQPLPDMTIVSDYPSVLNKKMARGDLDMGPISAAAYADILDNVLILPDFCLSSIGYVGSVILLSKVPLDALDGKKLGITSASRTSVILLKILLKKYYHQAPHYFPTSSRPNLKDLDAALVIGNDAMVRTAMPASYVYDLGDIWYRKTGYPVVFALFVVRKNIMEKYKDEINRVIDSYYASLRCLKTEKKDLIQKAAERYADILYDIDDYYDLLQFEFSEEMKRALMYYYKVAADMGLLNRVNKLAFFNGYAE